MGFGVVFPADGFDTFQDSGAGNAILMELDEHNEVFYRFASTLGAEEVEIATQDAFEQYIQAMATEIRTPPIIRFTPQESQEPEESQE
jgi:hypothetical protein